jgi:hypothetical protein
MKHNFKEHNKTHSLKIRELEEEDKKLGCL